MKLTDEQIDHIKNLMEGAIFKETRIADHILQLIADRQAWKEEVEELKEENQRLADNYNRDVYSADTEIIKLQNQLNQAVELLKMANSYLNSLRIDKFLTSLSQEGDNHET